MIFRYFILVFLSSASLIFADQGDSSNIQASYLLIYSDTDNVPVYIDGTLLGETPFLKPVPVLPGYHRISNIPHSMEGLYSSISKTTSVKQVYLVQGDTVSVFIDTSIQSQEILRQKRARDITIYTGLGIVLTFVVLLGLLTL